MKPARALWVFAIVALIAGFLFLLLLPALRRDVRLPDGSRLVLEKVSYGKLEPFQYGGWREKVKQHLPPALLSRFIKNTSTGGGSMWRGTRGRTNNALCIYFTHRDALSGGYAEMEEMRLEILDEHGCVFIPAGYGRDSDGRVSVRNSSPSSGMAYSVGWFVFDAYPRRERELHLRLYKDVGSVVNDFVVPNPALPPEDKTGWVAEEFPITKTNSGVSFVLASIKMKADSNHAPGQQSPWTIAPRYEVMEGGQKSPNWVALDTELSDSTGNISSNVTAENCFLCPQEPLWKLRVKFFASEQSRAASNFTWTIRGLTVPGQGKYLELNASTNLQGVALRPVIFGGPGNYEYSNEVPIKAMPLTEPLEHNGMSQNNTTSYGGGQFLEQRTIEGKTHHLMLDLGPLTPDQRLSVRAIDDQGREVYAREWQDWIPDPGGEAKAGQMYLLPPYAYRNSTLLALDLAPDAKTVDLTFCVHACYTPEFIFKPPAE